MGITFSDKSSSDEDILSDKPPKDETSAVKTALSKSRFSVSPVAENPASTLRLIKVPPKLTINTGKYRGVY